jgi:hypothetical protein
VAWAVISLEEQAENRVPDLVQRGLPRPKSAADMMPMCPESNENLLNRLATVR